MLSTTLTRHSEIHCFGEIFLPKHFRENYIRTGWTIRDILDSLSCPAGKKVLGFVVHYNELFQSNYTAGLGDELMKRNFRVIHLSRKNQLRRFLSKQVAFRTEVWTDTNGNHPSTLKVELSPIDLFFDIRRTVAHAEQTRRVFGDLPMLDISYEDLCADCSGQLARVCEFVGAPHEDITPGIFKQETRSLREAIINYDRLKRLYAVTRYRRYFED